MGHKLEINLEDYLTIDEIKEKDLLLTDLCARLPYGVKFKWCDNFHTDDYYTLISINEGQITGRDVNQDDCLFFWGQDKIKPYLRPMSSMTEEEKKEYIEYAGYEIEESVNGRHYEYYLKDFCGTPDNPSVNTNGVDWLNKKMFDYRGLVPKDLAISTEVFNPYNKD